MGIMTGEKIADVKIWFAGADITCDRDARHLTLVYNNEPDSVETIVEDLCDSLYNEIDQFQAVFNPDVVNGRDMVFVWRK